MPRTFVFCRVLAVHAAGLTSLDEESGSAGSHYYSNAARSAGWPRLPKDTAAPSPNPTAHHTLAPTLTPTVAPSRSPTLLEAGKGYVTSLEEAEHSTEGWRTSYDAEPGVFCVDQVGPVT